MLGRNSRLSSANSLVEELGDMDSERSLMYRRKRRRPRMVLCKPPEDTWTWQEEAPSSRTR